MEELEARFEELEEWSEEYNDVEDTGDNADMNESNGDEDELLTDIMRSNKVDREILGTEWEAKSLEVMKEEVSLKDISEQIKDKMLLMDRVELVEKGDVTGLNNMAKKASKLKYQLKSFGKSKPEDSWHCENCLLTGYDRDIQWKVCILSSFF